MITPPSISRHPTFPQPHAPKDNHTNPGIIAMTPNLNDEERAGPDPNLKMGTILNPQITLRKRIVMNPPQSYVDFATTFQTESEAPQPLNGPLMIGDQGQAVMVAPAPVPASAAGQNQVQTMPEEGEEEVGDGGQVVLKGSVIQVVPSSPTPTSSATSDSMVTPTPTPAPVATSNAGSDSATSSIEPTATSTLSPSSESGTSDIGSMPTSTASPLNPTNPITTDIATTTAPNSITSTSRPLGPTTTTSTPASTSTLPAGSPSSTSAAAIGTHHPPSAALIFLAIILSLVLFGALITLFRYLLRSRRIRLPVCLGGRRRGRYDDDDDDGLSDFVAGLGESPLHHHHHLYQDEKYDYGTGGVGGGGGYDYSSHAANGMGMGIGPTYDDWTTSTTTTMQPSHSHSHSHNHGLGLGLGIDTDHNGIQSRSNNFASAATTKNGQSPFLHSGTATIPSPPPQAYLGETAPRSFSQGGIAPMASGHSFGETGKLQVVNGLPDEIVSDSYDHEYEHEPEHERGGGVLTRGVSGVDGLKDIGLDGGSPRFLGVDGNGLPLPWNLPPRPDEMESRCPTPNSKAYHLSVGGPAPSFPSPLPSPSDDPFPQRSATWASNLRSTLYAAISAARVPTTGSLTNSTNPNGSGMEDRFTRTVGVVSGLSMKRGKLPIFDEEASTGPNTENGRGFPIVIEEKDDLDHQVLSFPTANTKDAIGVVPTDGIGSVLLTRMESDDSTSTLTLPRKFGGAGGNASERYKRYYARSKSSGSSTTTSEGGESEAETVGERRPSALAGGERVKGARMGSFVMA
ncbi:hypothetical protein CI109_103418 [Kwoniella shandongensis]|uniref:Uncharacterized protein n=1 Tax=Kwoniella shandongensis TaxID=1734106 RepID=A0A5M6BWF0_9TREE|nr:uncharacterized protein CI109_004499 [Kwoniella shandongensis]KAA5527206.1 hypothetical protein CI109_004499 [Kwoniella shandongensis]